MNQNKVYIQNFWYVNNYGACLTAFALYKILEQLDYDVNLIDVSSLGQSINYAFEKFIKKYCKTTNRVKFLSDIKNINDKNAIYITGSDQVFRPHLVLDNLKYFLFDYVNPCAKKVSFSASFGVDKEKFINETDSKIIEKMKLSLNSFDFVSVREKSGVDICKDLFDVGAEWIIDPVFILDKKSFENLTNEVSRDFKNKIVSCMFDKKNNQLDKFLEKKYSSKVVELWESGFTIEEWIAAIKNCKFLVTNSFHATCFAIIFNKPFICLAKDKGASSRFESLFDMLNIKDESVNLIDEIYERDCLFKIDYAKVNTRIAEESKKGLDFLNMILATPTSKTEEKIKANIQFLETEVCELEKEATLKYQIKKELWNLWIIIFHKYLPYSLKNIIRFMRNKYVR